MDEGREDGYVKLWRRSLRSDVWQNPKVWRVWCWMLMKATHKQIIQMVGYQPVDLNPGEFVFGRKNCSKETKVSENAVRTCLQALKLTNRITIKSSTKFSVVSIINWEQYQDEDVIRVKKNHHQKNQPATSKPPASHHKQTHNHNNNTNRESTSVDSLPAPELVDGPKPCPVEVIVNLFNTMLPSSPKCLHLTDSIRKQLATRWREDKKRQSIDWWRDLFTQVNESKFLTGRVESRDGRRFLVDFIWLVNATNFAKVLNGNYVDRDSERTTMVSRRTQANMQAVSAVEKLIEEGKV